MTPPNPSKRSVSADKESIFSSDPAPSTPKPPAAKAPAAKAPAGKAPAAKAPPAKAPAAKAPPAKAPAAKAPAPRVKESPVAEAPAPAAKAPPPRKSSRPQPAAASGGFDDLDEAAAMADAADPLASDPLAAGPETHDSEVAPASDDAKPKKSPNWLLIGGIVGGVAAAMIFAGCGATMAIFFLGGNRQPEIVAVVDPAAEKPAEGEETSQPADGEEADDDKPAEGDEGAVPAEGDADNPDTDPMAADPSIAADPADPDAVASVDPAAADPMPTDTQPADPKPADPKTPAEPATPEPAKPEPKPTPPKAPPKPPNPFRSLKPAVDLVASAADGKVDLGQVLLNKDEVLFVRLYGGDHAAGNEPVKFEMVDVAGETHTWQITAKESKNLPGGEGVVAHVKLVEKDLVFSWTDLAATEPASRTLRNCQLDLTTRSGAQKLFLRTPGTVEPLLVQLSKPTMKVDFSIEDLPDPKMVVIEVIPPAAPLAPNSFQDQQAGLSDGRAIMMKVGEPGRETLIFEFEPEVRRDTISVTGKALYQLAGMPKPVPFQAKAVSGMANGAGQQMNQLLQLKVQADKNKNNPQAKAFLANYDNQLAQLQQATAQVQELVAVSSKLMPATVKRGENAGGGGEAPVRFRVIYKYTPEDGFGSYDLILAE
ncbi:prolipoprotein diacylglyceryl transferase [Lignipirellula cremea]|uniref:Uncharacterized protein n=1 Tax=Lignipirellula cremea TaxID=2528010 RepID=A0A518DXS7_9BACT|nr:hypothetical protein [Lignipirellula cremea]QDU96656.1 hypothetical protein Pla8534_44770 [Lignipirellula cremea]